MKRITYTRTTRAFADRQQAETWAMLKMHKGWTVAIITPAAAGGTLWHAVAEWRDR